jgi:hypothetical protein
VLEVLARMRVRPAWANLPALPAAAAVTATPEQAAAVRVAASR